MSKIVWIISGPSVVGKSHFITKKSDRLSEIVDYRTHDLETFDPVDDIQKWEVCDHKNTDKKPIGNFFLLLVLYNLKTFQ
mgnify:CR=1 FL=1